MSTYEISKSSLLSLKAEILRKQQELTKAKSDNEIKIQVIKKKVPLDIKNKGVESRNQADQLNENEADLLKQSRSQLEFKSMLYDRLSQGHFSDEQQVIKTQYLVQFDKKNISNTTNLPPDDSEDEPDKNQETDSDYYDIDDDENLNDPGEKWVEYVDCLGRTRTCLQKDLNYLKTKDTELLKVVEAKRKVKNNDQNVAELLKESDNEAREINVNQESELLSSDMRREMVRQQWEKEEEGLRNKADIHYQDILFGEARTHGVGYYGFSKDEEERLKQQESLKILREETAKKQQKAQELKTLREKQLAARIKAAKDRKRVRLGLPPEEEEEKESKPQETEISKKDEQKEDEMNKKAAIEKLLDEARKKHIRPWDIGKDGIKTNYEMTQEEWVNKKRSERTTEFAPPSIYVHFGGKETEEKFNSRKSNASFENTTKRGENHGDKQKNKRRNLINNQVNKNEQLEKPTSTFINFEDQDFIESSYNRLEFSDTDSESRGIGPEIAPPPNYEYYEPSNKKFCKSSPKHIDIGESIEAGLRFLRKQIEIKQKIKK